MSVTHSVQLVLTAIAAGAATAAAFLPSHYQAVALAVSAVALSVKGALSVQSETSGDAKAVQK